MKIEIRPQWMLVREEGAALALPPLLRLLTEVRDQGSISRAAATVGLSYRHAWGLLREFDQQFGAVLVEKVRGKGTVLSPLAEKLIWADKRIEARLSPFLDSLASELERELAALLSVSGKALRVTASHGFAVAELIRQLDQHAIGVDLNYRGSTEAVAALARGECDLAGFHVPAGQFQQAAAAQYMKSLNPRQHALVHLAYRTQGLFIARGNPKQITGLADLTRADVRFVNRQVGSGTRVLLELFLKRARIATAAIAGYETAEFTHAAVAAYVASGMADVSFGVETAARRFDLDFIPLVRERYFFACERKALGEPGMVAALSAMQSPQFKDIVNGLAGYDGTLAGTVLGVEAMLETTA